MRGAPALVVFAIAFSVFRAPALFKKPLIFAQALLVFYVPAVLRFVVAPLAFLVGQTLPHGLRIFGTPPARIFAYTLRVFGAPAVRIFAQLLWVFRGPTLVARPFFLHVSNVVGAFRGA